MKDAELLARGVLIGIAVILLCCLLSLNCSSPAAATNALRGAGYTNIEITGWDFGCSDSDTTCTGFVATGPTGVRVRGVVGCGVVVKGCTIRTSVP